MFHPPSDEASASRSHRRQEVAPPSRFEATVSRRHCEKEAVLSPMPKRPRSSAALSSSGLFAPSVIAVSSSASVIPLPSSRTEILLAVPSQSNETRTSDAPAETPLSITSARAEAVE
jgi:hypothetical protein